MKIEDGSEVPILVPYLGLLLTRYTGKTQGRVCLVPVYKHLKPECLSPESFIWWWVFFRLYKVDMISKAC